MIDDDRLNDICKDDGLQHSRISNECKNVDDYSACLNYGREKCGELNGIILPDSQKKKKIHTALQHKLKLVSDCLNREYDPEIDNYDPEIDNYDPEIDDNDIIKLNNQCKILNNKINSESIDLNSNESLCKNGNSPTVFHLNTHLIEHNTNIESVCPNVYDEEVTDSSEENLNYYPNTITNCVRILIENDQMKNFMCNDLSSIIKPNPNDPNPKPSPLTYTPVMENQQATQSPQSSVSSSSNQTNNNLSENVLNFCCNDNASKMKRELIEKKGTICLPDNELPDLCQYSQYLDNGSSFKNLCDGICPQ